MRTGAIARLVLVGVVVGAITAAVAYFVPWLPEQASEQRERIDFVFWLTTWICVAIFAVVAAVTIYAGVKFRARADDDSDGLPIHGHTGLEIVWTAIPFVLVTVIAIASGVALARNERTDDETLRVFVTAQQFAWSFEYGDGLTSGTLRLPRGRTVELRLRARDVIHSFWVPEFGQKQDAVPGIETKLVITPTKLGTFPVICTELCGLGHAVMRSSAVVMPPAAFASWLRGQRERMEGEPREAGAAVFEERGCGSCHAFRPAGSTAEVGPPLDDLAADAREHGRRDAEAFVRESIVDPNAFVHPGYQPNVMPAFDELAERQLDALVQYLLQGASGGA